MRFSQIAYDICLKYCPCSRTSPGVLFSTLFSVIVMPEHYLVALLFALNGKENRKETSIRIKILFSFSNGAIFG